MEKEACCRVVKTTVDVPEDLWRAVKLRALDQRTDLRRVVIAALTAYLAPKGDEPT